MTQLKYIIFSGWHFRRWLGLSAGIFFAIQAITENDGMLVLFSVFFLFQALTNSGCFGSKGCSVEYLVNSQNNEPKEIEFKEIK